MNRFIKSLTHASQGIAHCILHHKNFQLQLFAAAIVSSVSVYFNIKSGEWLAIILCCTIVLALEMINTAIEELSNVVSPSYLAAIKTVKDISAGAVLLTSISSLITGLIIFIPYLKHLLHP